MNTKQLIEQARIMAKQEPINGALWGALADKLEESSSLSETLLGAHYEAMSSGMALVVFNPAEKTRVFTKQDILSYEYFDHQNKIHLTLDDNQ